MPLENVAILTCSSALTYINTTSFSERFDDADAEIKQLSKTPIEDVVEIEIASCNDDPDYKNHIVGCIARNIVRHVVVLPLGNVYFVLIICWQKTNFSFIN